MSAPMSRELALDLALTGRINAASPEVTRLVELAGRLAELPDPQIDPRFAARLEAILLAEPIETPAAPERPLKVVRPAAAKPAVQPERKATPTPPAPKPSPVIPLPRRRIVLRKGLVAAVAAVMALAFPIVASASALPGSPLYGLRLKIESTNCALKSGVNEGFCHLGFAQHRMDDARQVVALGHPENVGKAVGPMQSALSKGANQVIESGSPSQIAQAGRIVASTTGALAALAQRMPAGSRADVLDAMRASEQLSTRISAALGEPTRVQTESAPSRAGTSADRSNASSANPYSMDDGTGFRTVDRNAESPARPATGGPGPRAPEPGGRVSTDNDAAPCLADVYTVLPAVVCGL